MVKEVASHTSDVAGDGTTTATVLAQSIVNEGLKAVAAAWINGLETRIDLAVIKVVEAVVASATPCTDNKAIAQVVPFQQTLMSQSVKSLPKPWKSRQRSVITVEEGSGLETS